MYASFVQKIQGNTGGAIVKHYLDEPVLTRYIRFEVVSFSGPHQCMRIEIYGCAPGAEFMYLIFVFLYFIERCPY